MRPAGVNVLLALHYGGVSFSYLELPNVSLWAWSSVPRTSAAMAPYLIDMLPDAAGLVFVIDSSDTERFNAAAEQLQHLLDIAAFARLPLLVLANKTDRPDAASTEAISTAFRLADIHGRVVLLRSCSMESGEGVDAAMAWLTDAVVL